MLTEYIIRDFNRDLNKLKFRLKEFGHSNSSWLEKSLKFPVSLWARIKPNLFRKRGLDGHRCREQFRQLFYRILRGHYTPIGFYLVEDFE